jgi:hypothetical protein
MDFNNKKYSNIFSHDAWIFKSPMKYPINIDISLGEMFSDSYLDYKLKNSTYYLKFSYDTNYNTIWKAIYGNALVGIEINSNSCGIYEIRFIEAPIFEGAIEFKNVKFSYIDNEEVIKGINLSVQPGQTIAIVGATGAGATGGLSKPDVPLIPSKPDVPSIPEVPLSPSKPESKTSSEIKINPNEY